MAKNETARPSFSIRPATADDVDLVFQFILELAKFEKLEHEVTTNRDELKLHLFGEKPPAEVLLAHVGNQCVGFALFFTSFSTFLGKPGLYLEDLYVAPAHRGLGCGRGLLVRLAQLTIERGYGRLEWSVLDWNQKAIDLYLSIGAKPMNEWTVHRLTGDPLAKLASTS